MEAPAKRISKMLDHEGIGCCLALDEPHVPFIFGGRHPGPVWLVNIRLQRLGYLLKAAVTQLGTSARGYEHRWAN